MNHFEYRDNQLFAEEVAVTDIANRFGSPCYVYSRATIERHWRAFDNAAKGRAHLICYAVKANSNLAVLNLMARMGSGFDIVSKGELARVIEAGGDPGKVVFSGVAKTEDEIRFALEKGIHCFNAESDPEIDRINKVAGEMGLKAPLSIRINPDVDAKTHPYISTGLKANKFGIEWDQAIAIYQRAAAMEHIDIIGVDCHIGSQLTEIDPFIDALDRILHLIDQLSEQGIHIKHLDVGGGLGVTYDDEQPPHPNEYAAAIVERLKDYPHLELIFEPGRAIMANAGIFITQVEFIKSGEEKNFAIVDGAMNDLIRPSLYQAWQRIIPVVEQANSETVNYDVVGPVCETGDFLGKDRDLAIQPGDLLAVCSAGAYGFTMSSNYNSRPRVAEVLVDGAQTHLIRQRESIESLWQGEQVLPE